MIDILNQVAVWSSSAATALKSIDQLRDGHSTAIFSADFAVPLPRMVFDCCEKFFEARANNALHRNSRYPFTFRLFTHFVPFGCAPPLPPPAVGELGR